MSEGPRIRRPVCLSRLAQAVCERVGVRFADVVSRQKRLDVTVARGLIVWLGRELNHASWPELAAALGRPGAHSTAIGAYRRTDRLVRADAALRLRPAWEETTYRTVARQVAMKVTNRDVRFGFETEAA
jgi:chromosomal replication initiation ATPase DnaA